MSGRLLALGSIVLAALVLSAVGPYDRVTWWMEVAPVLVVLPLLFVTRARFPLTPLLYVLIALHALVRIVGGAYTYARVPAGFWVQEAFDLSRNPYDKLGHFMQGFVPALAAREILLRTGSVASRRIANFVAVCVALAVSASYELIEWAAALALGQGADEFLGTQGDPWDTQSDMFMALVGALVALVSLSAVQDRQIARRVVSLAVLAAALCQTGCVTDATLKWRRDEVSVQGRVDDAMVIEVKNVPGTPDGRFEVAPPVDWRTRSVVEAPDGVLEVQPLEALSLTELSSSMEYPEPMTPDEARGPLRLEGDDPAVTAFVVRDDDRVFHVHLLCADTARKGWVRVGVADLGPGSQSSARGALGLALVPFAVVLDVASLPILIVIASYSMNVGD